MKNLLGLCCALAVTGSTTAYAVVVASDDFDSPVNLISYSAIDAEGNDPTNNPANTGTWSSPFDNFGPRSINDYPGPPLDPNGNWVSYTLIDETSLQADTRGIIPLDYSGGNFFAIVDTDNNPSGSIPGNPSGVVTGTWVFDISSAASLASFEVDMAAIGNFYDDGSAFEQFKWAYSIDGGLETELFTVRANASAGPVTYTMDDNTTLTVLANTGAGPDDNGVTINGTPLLNELTTISTPMTGSGNELTLTLWGYVNDNNAGLVVENIVINGADTLPGDFDMDNDVDGVDLLEWQLGQSPIPLSQIDLNDWTNNYGTVLSVSAVPEPSVLVLVLTAALGLASRGRLQF